MRAINLVDHLADLLRETRHGSFPSDRILRRFSHAHRQLGSRERTLLGDAYYHMLRHLLRFDEGLKAGFDSMAVISGGIRSIGFPVGAPASADAWSKPADLKNVPWTRLDRWMDQARGAIAAEELKPGLLEEVIPELIKHWPAKVMEVSEPRLRRHLLRASELAALALQETKPLRLPVKHSIPEWLWGLMGFGLPLKEIDAAVAALNSPGATCLRVNTLKTSVAEVEAQFGPVGIPVRRSEFAPSCLVAERRIPQGRLPALGDGRATFQDEGSQLLSEIVAPRPGDRVVDACAGAGGKTLHLAALMGGEGRLYVHDVSEKRFANLFDRAKEAGVTIVERLDRQPAQPLEADLVVLDVPCTGTGTLRRSPELKWRLSRAIVEERVALQKGLLDQWSAHVRPGGRLAYMTCSLLAEENSAQIDAFLARSADFTRIDLAAAPHVRRDMVTRTGDVQLHPHRHGTDGFFLSLLQRRG